MKKWDVIFSSILTSLESNKTLLLEISSNACDEYPDLNEINLVNLINEKRPRTINVIQIENPKEYLLTISKKHKLLILHETCMLLNENFINSFNPKKITFVIGGYKGYPKEWFSVLKELGSCFSLGKMPYQVHQVIEVIKYVFKLFNSSNYKYHSVHSCKDR